MSSNSTGSPNSSASSSQQERISAIFSKLDTDKDGRISVSELSSAIKLRFPNNDDLAEKVISSGDTNSDNTMDFQEFLKYMQEHETQLRLAFDNLDRNKDKTIDAVEIQSAMADLGVQITIPEAQRLLSKMDQDGNLSIDFDEWRDFLVFSASTNIESIFSYWRYAPAIDIGDNRACPDDFTEAEKKTGVAYKTLLAGGLAGAVSRTATAPLDRLKVLWQAQAGSGKSEKGGMIKAIKNMIQEGGFLSLFRGNGVNVIKIAPETALKFLTYEKFKDLVLRGEKREVKLSEKFVSGALAGATSQTIIYPMELLKTRMCLRKTGQYSSIFDCAKKVYAEGGVRVFYRGYVPNILGILPYAGIDLALFETFKNMYITMDKARNGGKAGNPPVYVSLVCGATSSVCGQLATYPLALVRTKLQAQSKDSKDRTMSAMFQSIVKREGLTGLYRGIIPNMLKVIPAVSISYAVFDKARAAMNI